MTEIPIETEVMHTITHYEVVIGHAASRTRLMIERLGEIEALSRLMVSAELQKGFKALRDRSQLDKTFESVVVRYQHLFGTDVVKAAKWRLAHPFELL